MAKITNSLGIIVNDDQDNIDIFKTFYTELSFDPINDLLTQINNSTPFIINKKESLWIRNVIYSEIEGVQTILQTNIYKIVNVGKGDYGLGKTPFEFTNLELVATKQPSVINYTENPDTQVEVIEDLLGLTIYEYINQKDPAYNVQLLSVGRTVFITPEGTYLFLKDGGLYGLNEINDLIILDFQLLERENTFATMDVVNLKANDDAVVHKTGAELIEGTKTFGNIIVANQGMNVSGPSVFYDQFIIIGGANIIGTSDLGATQTFRLNSFYGDALFAGIVEASEGKFNNGLVYTKAKNISFLNLDDYTSAGFYEGNNMTNAPSGGWFYVTVERYNTDSSWAHQTATSFGSGNLENRIYSRVKASGAWSVWKELATKTDIPKQKYIINQNIVGTGLAENTWCSTNKNALSWEFDFLFPSYGTETLDTATLFSNGLGFLAPKNTRLINVQIVFFGNPSSGNADFSFKVISSERQSNVVENVIINQQELASETWSQLFGVGNTCTRDIDIPAHATFGDFTNVFFAIKSSITNPISRLMMIYTFQEQ